MSGLDQDMMQKNLTCKNLKEAQKNMLTFSAIFVGVVWMFLTLGALLYLYAESHQITLPQKSDDLYPLLAINHMSIMIGVFFLLGITAANYASADSALTSLTTAFCIDFLNFEKSENKNKKRILKITHLGFSLLLFVVIMVFKAVNNQSVVMAVFKVAGLTYGPLLGLFSFGLLTKYRINDRLVPLVVIASPLLSWLLNNYSEQIFNGYQIGFELIIINGALTFAGLFLIRLRNK
jgi:Na+/proline symporter